MRFLLKVNIPVESGNAAAKAGKLGAIIQSILADLKPEAVYFTDNNGQRAGFLFLDEVSLDISRKVRRSLDIEATREVPHNAEEDSSCGQPLLAIENGDGFLRLGQDHNGP